MQVRIKLMGTLQPKSPEGGTLQVPEGATVEAVLRLLEISSGGIQVFLINGSPKRDLSHQLEADDELTVLGPVGGG